MSLHHFWNRRELLQGAGSLLALQALPGLASSTRTRYAYAGSTDGGGSIHVFAVDGSRWKPLQTIASQRPVCLALRPSGKVLYAVNEVADFDGLPRGSVESFAIDTRTGHLARLNRQALSLSGTLPRHLALSPDGRHLVVAIYGGGACNVLPIARDGSLGPVFSIVKHTGAGPHPEHQQSAHAHTVLFDPSGRYVVTSDLGADRLSVYTLHEGCLTPLSRTALAPGSGPGQMSLHPSGHLFVANHLESTISTFTFRPEFNAPLTLLDTTPVAEGTITLQLSGNRLYTAVTGTTTTLTNWSIHPAAGALSRVNQIQVRQASLHLAQASPTDRSAYLLDQAEGAILHFARKPRRMADVPQPRSLVLL